MPTVTVGEEAPVGGVHTKLFTTGHPWLWHSPSKERGKGSCLCFCTFPCISRRMVRVTFRPPSETLDSIFLSKCGWGWWLKVPRVLRGTIDGAQMVSPAKTGYSCCQPPAQAGASWPARPRGLGTGEWAVEALGAARSARGRGGPGPASSR